ncbi:MAG: hypothetical protein KDH88_20305 [Chromatiales bacterium]|nr:hypothetical protein [Chromatiales bacterium]
MQSLRLGVIAAGFCAALATHEASAFVIDTFEHTQAVSAVASVGSSTESPVSGAVFAERTLSATRVSGTGSVQVGINAAASGTLDYATSFDTLGFATISYTAAGGGDITPGADLTASNSLTHFGISIINGDFPVGLTLTVRDTDSNSFSMLQNSPVMALNDFVSFEFAEFRSAGVDLRSVEFLSLRIESPNPNTNFVASEFLTFHATAPTPGTVTLLALGLIGMGTLRKY